MIMFCLTSYNNLSFSSDYSTSDRASYGENLNLRNNSLHGQFVVDFCLTNSMFYRLLEGFPSTISGSL